MTNYMYCPGDHTKILLGCFLVRYRVTMTALCALGMYAKMGYSQHEQVCFSYIVQTLVYQNTAYKTYISVLIGYIYIYLICLW